MNKFNKRFMGVRITVTALLALSMILAACASPNPAPEATTAPGEVATQAPAVVTEAPPNEAPATEAPLAEVVTEVPPTEAPAATEAATQAAALDPSQYSPDIPDPEKPVVVSFASWVHTGEADDAWEALAKKFNEIHPNITIEFQDVPSEEMHDKLLTQIAANNPPDTAYIDSGTTGEFGTRNALVQLDDYVAKSKVIDMNDYVPAFLTSAKSNGKLFGLPIDGESTGLFYRTDRFVEAGLDPTKPPATWEEFQQTVEKLTNKDQKKYGYAVFATDYESSYYFLPWLWQTGGDTLNLNDPNDVIWDSPEGQKAADFYVNLKNYSPADLLNSNSWDGRTAFANGDVAMYMAGAWFAGVLMSEFPDANGKWNAAPLPQDKKCATTIAGDHLVIFKASKNPDAAYKWIEFVSAPENMAMLNLGTEENPSTLLPPRLSLLNDPKTYEGRPFLKGFADNMKCAVVSEVVQEKYGEMDLILSQYLNQAFYGKMTGAEAVKQAAIDAEALVK